MANEILVTVRRLNYDKAQIFARQNGYRVEPQKSIYKRDRAWRGRLRNWNFYKNAPKPKTQKVGNSSIVKDNSAIVEAQGQNVTDGSIGVRGQSSFIGGDSLSGAVNIKGLSIGDNTNVSFDTYNESLDANVARAAISAISETSGNVGKSIENLNKSNRETFADVVDAFNEIGDIPRTTKYLGAALFAILVGGLVYIFRPKET